MLLPGNIQILKNNIVGAIFCLVSRTSFAISMTPFAILHHIHSSRYQKFF